MTESLAALLSAVVLIIFAFIFAIVAGVTHRNNPHTKDHPLVIGATLLGVISLVLAVGFFIASFWAMVA